MNGMDINFSPAIIQQYCQMPSSLIDLLTSIALATSTRSTVAHSQFIAATPTSCSTLLSLAGQFYRLLSCHYLGAPLQMPRQSSTRPDDSKSAPWNADCPDPDPNPIPEPPSAPPIGSPCPSIIILSESGNARAAPHFQVPNPAGVEPQSPTSSASEPTPRYNLRKRQEVREQTRPDKPEPEPHPAPPVIILSTNKRRASASPPLSTTPPSITSTTYTDLTSPTISTSTTHSHPTNTIPAIHERRMGSRASKLAPSHGKLQPSQERQDKEEMKEPSNYYSHRSKSMRRKAGKAEGGVDAGGAVGGTAGGAGGGGIA
ncbi:Nn.00g010900.m01.CDS01 [Neocucurbitaria sp. VM-36]